MEVTKSLDHNSRSTAKYAIITRNKTGHEVWTATNEPWHRLPWSEDIALKDVEYNIIEGVLYIKGTQIYFYNVENLLDIVTLWGKRSIFTISKERNEKLLLPFMETDIYIKRWWWKNKKIRGIDLTDQDVKRWYQSKIETPCEVALSNFKLVEQFNDNE